MSATTTLTPSPAHCLAAVEYLSDATGLRWKTNLKSSHPLCISSGPHVVSSAQTEWFVRRLKEPLQQLQVCYSVDCTPIEGIYDPPNKIHAKLLNPDSTVPMLAEEYVKQERGQKALMGATITLTPFQTDCLTTVKDLSCKTGLPWKINLESPHPLRISLGPYEVSSTQATRFFERLELLKGLGMRYSMSHISIMRADGISDLIHGELLNPDSAVQMLTELKRVKQQRDLARRSAGAATRMLYDARTPAKKPGYCSMQ